MARLCHGLERGEAHIRVGGRASARVLRHCKPVRGGLVAGLGGGGPNFDGPHLVLLQLGALGERVRQHRKLGGRVRRDELGHGEGEHRVHVGGGEGAGGGVRTIHIRVDRIPAEPRDRVGQGSALGGVVGEPTVRRRRRVAVVVVVVVVVGLGLVRPVQLAERPRTELGRGAAGCHGVGAVRQPAEDGAGAAHGDPRAVGVRP